MTVVKTKSNVIVTANHNITRNHWKLQVGKKANCLKRGKMKATKVRLVLVLNLIGWESSASFLDQLLIEVKQNQSTPGLLSSLNYKLLSHK